MQRARWLGNFLAATLAGACNPAPVTVPPDGAVTPAADAAAPVSPDSAVRPTPVDGAIAPPPDAPVTPPRDAGMTPADAGAPPTDGAVAAAGPCAPSALVDLNARGTRMGAVLHYTGDTTGLAPASPLPSPSCRDITSHQLVLRYVPATTARLRVSTNNPATAFDTLVWALNACGTPGAMELGCQDDDNYNPHASASTLVTTDRVTAGAPVYLVVAGSGMDASGAFELTVSELAEVPLGSACDPSGATSVCAGGNVCVTDAGNSRCEVPAYTESAVPGVAFLDACAVAGSHVALVPRAPGADPRDDGHSAAAIPLPFAFQYFRSAVSSVFPSTNGYATFDVAPTDSGGGDGEDGLGVIPTRDEGAVLAPLWQNLALRAAPASDLCTATFGAAPARKFVIEWLDLEPAGSDTAHITFEAVLTEGSNTVDFLYRTIDAGSGPTGEVDGGYATIGIQSPQGVRSARHWHRVDTANAVRFTPSSM